MDYDLETQAILRALKEGQQLADTPINLPMVGEGRGVKFMSGPSPAGIDRMLGQYQISQAEERQRKMNESQTAEFDRLTKELATPVKDTRTVLKQTLRQGEGPLLEPNFDQTSVEQPLTPEEIATAEHNKRIGIAPQMMKLPMARAVAEKLYAKGIDFPEQQQQLKLKQIEAGEQAAQRAADREAQLKRDEQLRRDLANQSSADRRYMVDTASADRRYALDNKGPSAADLKRQDAQENKDTGRAALDDTLFTIRDRINKLDELGGTTNEDKNALYNVGASVASSGPGQLLGKAFGTKEQTLRDELNSLQLQLLSSIKEATGMSSKAIDSNAELKTWLASLGDASMSKQARLQIVDNIERKYLSGGKVKAPDGGAPTGDAPVTKTYGGVTYKLKPGTSGKNKSDWIPQ